MFYDLNVFKTAYAMATHAGQRQAVIARNMANADTPGYQPRDIQSFKDAFETSGRNAAMMATRQGHLHGGTSAQGWAEFDAVPSGDPNGNGVSLEEEMLKSVDVKRQHDRALAIYKSSMNILRASLGRGYPFGQSRTLRGLIAQIPCMGIGRGKHCLSQRAKQEHDEKRKLSNWHSARPGF